MDIKFKVHDKEYQIKGSTNDFILYEYYGIKKNKKTNEDEDNNKLIGYFGNIFQALSFIPDYHALNSEVTTLKELETTYKQVLCDIKTIAGQFKITNN